MKRLKKQIDQTVFFLFLLVAVLFPGHTGSAAPVIMEKTFLDAKVEKDNVLTADINYDGIDDIVLADSAAHRLL
ncbi:MAG: hypothetical protein U1C12_01545, partial [Patescibacteria group bacterium]|nr:hypothetical protein [Patescibacteria group bacterium]